MDALSNDSEFSMHPALLRQLNMTNSTQRFESRYRSYETTLMPGSSRDNVSFGGKCILPASALEKLSRLNVTYPMLFQIINEQNNQTSHLGVLEFIAEEGRIYLPPWIMKNLRLSNGDLVTIYSIDIPRGTFIKLQPQSVEFLDISDPKAVLENVFRNFSTLTENDIFEFKYNDKIYKLSVLQVLPENQTKAISVVETDIEVDFATPLGYVEPEPEKYQFGPIAKQLGIPELLMVKASGQKLSGRSFATESQMQADLNKPLRVAKGILFFGFDFCQQEKQESKGFRLR